MDIASFNYEAVIYVPGNHEYYHGDINEVNDILMGYGLNTSNLFVMINGEDFKVKNINFIGGTLWTDLSNPIAELAVTSCMNDFHIITNGIGVYSKAQKFRGSDATYIHNATKNVIFDKLIDAQKVGSLNKTVVVTHHAPSELSVHPRFAGDSMNPGYFSNLENHIALVPPKFWVHGHVHNTMSYEIEGCKILTNPRGYHQYGVDENREFDPDFVFDV